MVRNMEKKEHFFYKNGWKVRSWVKNSLGCMCNLPILFIYFFDKM